MHSVIDILPAPRTVRPRRAPRILLVFFVAASVALAVFVLVGPGFLPPASSDDAAPGGSDLVAPPGRAATTADGPDDDGVLPPGATAFDGYSGVARLDGPLLQALRDATVAAADDGVTLTVTSGWRSAEYQERLLRESIADYGSADEAARWVASSSTSLHVSGRAADVGGIDAIEWIAHNGDAYGLCRTYDNEPWHVEYFPDAPVEGCPRAYPDPTYDTRMRR